MEEFPNLFSGWSWEENKMFELALAVVEENDPDRWEVVSAMVGGRSAEEVKKHYEILLQDLQLIESGDMDHSFEAAYHSCPIDSSSSSSTTTSNAHLACWTDGDHKRLVDLEIN